jgi:hypothetical protein
MAAEAICSGLLGKDRPENVIRVFVPPQTESNNVTAYLMLKFNQAFESSALLFSGQVKAKGTAMNRKVTGDESEKKLLVRVRQRQIPASQIVVIHTAFPFLVIGLAC